MVADVATGRDAVAENSLLMNQTEQPQHQLGSKKGKKKKKTAAPVDSVQTSLNYLSQLVSRLESQVAEMKEENNQQVAEMEEEIKKHSHKLLAEVKEIKKHSHKLLAEVKEIKKHSSKQREESGELTVQVNSLLETRKAMWNIYRRMLFDQARTQILDVTGINRGDLDSSALLAAVKARLPNPFVLNDVALEMIFMTRPALQAGNTAADEAFIALSVIESDLSSSERVTLAAVYKYVYGTEPTN